MKSKPILVSACLTGLPCRYDGTDKNRRDLEHLPFCIPLCPEQLAGFSTPREPAEQDEKGRVIRLYSQEDVTAAFHRGAFAVLEYCRTRGIKKALLKGGSPSCGKGGVTADLLEKNGVEVEYID
jgi:uncharacterized protein YbbK (DUF523 family)